MSQKGRTVFSEEYARAIRATPHLKYKTSLLAWVVLAGFVILMGYFLLGCAAAPR